jgi:hypothetical protein
MGGAALTRNVHHLVLYEPSFGLRYPPGAIDAIERAVAAGDPEGAIRAAFVDTGVMTDEDFEAFKASPRWSKVVASAPTLPRECRVEDGWVYQPGQFDAISAPTLMLTGSETDPELAECTQRAATASPNAAIRVLDGPVTSPTRRTPPWSPPSSVTSSARHRQERAGDRRRPSEGVHLGPGADPAGSCRQAGPGHCWKLLSGLADDGRSRRLRLDRRCRDRP